ncbi:MAG: hypothetical protein JW384_03169 [Nitrosomonadaceae bacterium]|nr:hypothetical protein [Nitrosomonadaceae bacterium]
MEESGTIKTDIDEGRLHSREYPADATAVNITDNAVVVVAFYVQLLYHTLLHQGYTCLLRGDVDKDFTTHK